jgi:putative transposase
MNIYNRHRFPSDIISYVVCLYYRFNLNHRDIKYLLAEGVITATRSTVHL